MVYLICENQNNVEFKTCRLYRVYKLWDIFSNKYFTNDMTCCHTWMSLLVMSNHPSYIHTYIYICLKLCFFSNYQNPYIVDLNWKALGHETKPVVNEYFIRATSAEQILLSSSQMPLFTSSAGIVVTWDTPLKLSETQISRNLFRNSFVPSILIA